MSADVVSADVMTETQRGRFYGLLPQLLATDPRVALVLADIGVSYLGPETLARFPDRIVNVGIREQLMIGVTGGLALAGMRPIAHTFPTFLIERPFEQVKLDLGHQGVGAVLVSTGGSYGWAGGGETHFGSRDVPLLDTLDGWSVDVPGHPDETEMCLRAAVARNDLSYIRMDNTNNRSAFATNDGSMTVLRRGSRGTVVTVGPLADRTLVATEGLDVTVLYASTVRPFDAATLMGTLGTPAVVLVEPYQAGTTVTQVARALADRPSRILGLGVSPIEQRAYGSMADHDRLHGLDVAGLRDAISRFV